MEKHNITTSNKTVMDDNITVRWEKANMSFSFFHGYCTTSCTNITMHRNLGHIFVGLCRQE